MTVNNAIYLRRRRKICLPAPQAAGKELPPQYAASVLTQAEALGFTFSAPLLAACRALTLAQLSELYHTLMPTLSQIKGAHRAYTPMYPNFPAQVMALDEGRLYLNAIVHYLSGGRLFPRTETKKRGPRWGDDPLDIVDLGTEAEFEDLFGQIAGSNASLSAPDKEDLSWFVTACGDDIGRLLPAAVPQKETMAALATLLMAHTGQAEKFLARFCRTATDVLRLAAGLSGGDVSLAAAAKFRAFSRPERRLLLGLIERSSNPAEDMLRWKKRWLRLGEKLHPGEFGARYPKALEAFGIVRNGLPLATLNRSLEAALAAGDVLGAVKLLTPRPGEFTRRLDHLLRLDASAQEAVLEAFGSVAGWVSTPVLLQVMIHFQTRRNPPALRVFFPKGSLAKAHGEPNTLPALPPAVCAHAAEFCRDALLEHFAALAPLGITYVDPALANFPVPFSQRSASKSLRTISRGSRLPLPPGGDTLRLFVWWKNGTDRTDIDLSATFFDDSFRAVDAVTYYSLRCDGGVHSGDIVDAPNGASEFIDIDLARMSARSVRYAAMTLGGYTPQPFCDLPECFAGWMARTDAQTGEIYDPRTVQDRLDLSSDSRIALPLVADLKTRTLLWCDMALKHNPNFVNNVHANLGGIALTLWALANLRKPTLYDLFWLHAKARGTLAETPAQAETIFSVAAGTPFHLEKIGSQFLR